MCAEPSEKAWLETQVRECIKDMIRDKKYKVPGAEDF